MPLRVQVICAVQVREQRRVNYFKSLIFFELPPAANRILPASSLKDRVKKRYRLRVPLGIALVEMRESISTNGIRIHRIFCCHKAEQNPPWSFHKTGRAYGGAKHFEK